jgi:hypothetical protein
MQSAVSHLGTTPLPVLRAAVTKRLQLRGWSLARLQLIWGRYGPPVLLFQERVLPIVHDRCDLAV